MIKLLYIWGHPQRVYLHFLPIPFSSLSQVPNTIKLLDQNVGRVGARLCCSPTSFSPTERSAFTPKSLRLNPKEAYGKSLRVNCVSFEALDARRRELLGESTPGVVMIRFKEKNTDFKVEKVTQVTAGYIVSENGLIMTCSRCISPKRVKIDPVDGNVVYFPEGNIDVVFSNWKIPNAEAKVLTVVRDLGIAVIQVPFLPDLLQDHVIRFSKSDALLGDTCFVIGHPWIEYASRSGVISCPKRYPYQFEASIFESLFRKVVDGYHLMELDVRAKGGLSGSPVVNAKGEAVGMIVMSAPSTVAVPESFCQAVLSYASKKKETDPVEMEGSSFVTVDHLGMEAKEMKNRLEE
ncbi:hypothetical protein Vadar_025299 [Vaccinium darrowii]|uniref:Uncharacterized protein n=1 Tax=Vaccinium darrowii TaxID=229202 RepID=A0ACB7YPZ6_9ERIC|nr:hypothetical protein Vadar_025299 [Vaccinium darrowii]